MTGTITLIMKIIFIQEVKAMTVLAVGADRLGNIPKELEQHGCKKLIHWDGRKIQNKSIPAKVDMVLIFHDFVSHRLMGSIKVEAKKRGLPIVYSKRGTVDLKLALSGHKSI
jgi:hypothetical protein